MKSTSTRFFRHYKNKPYKYLGTVHHSETLEELVLYETLYQNETGQFWVRPKDMFFSDVEINGAKRPRFEKIMFDFKVTENLTETELAQVRELHQVCFGSVVGEDFFQTKLALHKRCFSVLAYEGEKLLGYKIGYALGADLFYSWLGAVEPDHRHLGLASELLLRQHQWCREQGFSRIETRTRNKFLSMLRLNLKYGFEITGMLTDDRGAKIILQKKLN